MRHKQIFSAILVLLLVFCFALSAQAKERASRQGFNFAFGLYGLGGLYHQDHTGGFMLGNNGHLRFGYGFNEKISIFAETSATFNLFGDVVNNLVLIPAFSVGAKYFPLNNYDFFVTPKVGLAPVFVTVTPGPDTSALGGLGGIGAGYEWRFGKRFAIGPEARADYIYGGGSGFFGGVLLNLQWY